MYARTPRLLLVPVLLLSVACSDDGSGDSRGSASQVTSSPTTPTTPSTLDTTSIGTTEDSATDGSTVSGTESDSGTTAALPTTSVTETGPGMVTETGTTGPECVCEPGDTMGCDEGGLLTCKDDCSGFEPVPCPNGQSCVDGTCSSQLCKPGQKVCEGLDAEKACNAQGDGYEPPVACGPTQECGFAGCTELCELIKSDPSSVGCVFRGNKMLNFEEEPTAIAVGNVSKTKTATVSLFFFEDGGEKLASGPVEVAPGASHVFTLNQPPQPGVGSVLRPDSTFKVVSTVPVVAYQHSPIAAEAHNDSSMLLPDHAQQRNYIVMSYTATLGSAQPSYVNIIGLVDGTEVTWTPPMATLGGGDVPAVPAGGTGTITINDYDMLQISAGGGDISGTIVTLSQPAWVVGAVRCANIPAGVTYCDHVEEQMIPIEYWGTKYVGAHAPKRGNENYRWRVFASEDNTTITTEPAQPGFPITLNRGQFHEFATKTSFVFSGDKPFMPVQYLEGENGGAGTGDPASYQMVPVEQFLDRYVFVTGTGYNPNYVQVVRPAGGPDVLVDGQAVTGYYTVGDYEVADWKISQGSHLAESAAPFGIYQVGYTGVTSYAYPGGLRLKVINPQ